MNISLIDNNILKKKNIIDDLLSDNLNEYEDYLNEKSNQCNICCMEIRKPTKLTCGHIFCYQCLKESYKGIKCNFYFKMHHRICPYCRKPSNYLVLQEGEKAIKGIHSEYGKHISITKCKAHIKTGPKAGQICNCNVRGEGDLCGRHSKKNKDLNNII
jgi:hypothetical protein